MNSNTGADEKQALAFELAPLPKLITGPGTIYSVPDLLKQKGYARTALITGGKSYSGAVYRDEFEHALRRAGLEFRHFQVSGEPSPDTVDAIGDVCRRDEITGVLAVGGGSVIDTGKAVAAMQCHAGSVAEYLEGVGDKTPGGNRVPLSAIPTTSGTGSEATKNAVISRVGSGGYKKSLRHEGFIPDLAVLDPEVVLHCPAEITAAAGMDALTQLLEAFVSTKASPFTDALAADGLRRAAWALPEVIRDGASVTARSQMAYAAYISGVCLANAGLGVVHGAASPAGALRKIPHGVVCGTLLPSATEVIISALLKGGTSDRTGLEKYSAAAVVLTGRDRGTPELNCGALVELLYQWADDFGMPGLSDYGFTLQDLERISSQSSLKATPVDLDREEIYQILKKRLF